MQTEHRRPYRIVVFATGLRAGRRYKRYTQLVRTDYAYMGWTPEQHYQEARLPSAGSFLYPGVFAVYRAAREFLALPGTRQVSIRTNQDRQVYRYFKHEDGRITGYGGE
jgi:hypothetical protein